MECLKILCVHNLTKKLKFIKTEKMQSARLIFTNLFSNPTPKSLLIQQIRNLSVTQINYCSKETEESKPSTERILSEKEKSRDRTKIIPVETSIKYLASEAYQATYGNRPVWEQYRRNFKGGFAPRKTRKLCIRAGVISTGNPCPICRDEYLILDYRNLDLLKQFISEHSGQVSSWKFVIPNTN